MWLVDDSNSSGTLYVFPLTSQLVWSTQVQMTPMPIPLQNNPLLLNFGGAQPQLTINWVVTSAANGNYSGTPAGDWNLLMNVGWGSSTAGYTLYLPEVSPIGSTISVSGFIYNISLTYVAGQPNTYTGALTMYLGTVV